MVMGAEPDELADIAATMHAEKKLPEIVPRGPALFVTDPVMGLHRPEDVMPGHPESSERLTAVFESVRMNVDSLDGLEFSHPAEIPQLGLVDLLRVHDEDLVRTLLQWDGATRRVDNDLVITPHSVRASLRACDCVAHAIEAVTRPPPAYEDDAADAAASEAPEATQTDRANLASITKSVREREAAARAAAEEAIARRERRFMRGIRNGDGVPIRRAFAAVRPPAHHTERDRALGMCMFNSTAVGVAWALANGRARKVLVLDLDPLAGNGTQEIFSGDKRVLYFSVHATPHYPFSGFVDQGGSGGAPGHTVNMQMDTESTVTDWFSAMSTMLPLLIREFEPDLIVAPVGYGHHVEDPLCPLAWQDGDFVTLLSAAMQAATARVWRDIPIVFTLEGGYNPHALARLVPLSLKTILGLQQPAPVESVVTQHTQQMVQASIKHHQHHWVSLRQKVLAENTVQHDGFEEVAHLTRASNRTPDYSNIERAWETRDRVLEVTDQKVARSKLIRELTDPVVDPDVTLVQEAFQHASDPTRAAPVSPTAAFAHADISDPRVREALQALSDEEKAANARAIRLTDAQQRARERGSGAIRTTRDTATYSPPVVVKGPAAWEGLPRPKEVSQVF